MILGVSSLKFSVFHSQRDLHYGVDLLAFFADSCEGVFIVSPEFAERERERAYFIFTRLLGQAHMLVF